jgi:8-oxo-dGTP pyrophosphatase MutT (NUDIX family)
MDLGSVADHTPSVIEDEDRDAAVLVPIVDRPDGPAILFIKRSDRLGQHPGQMGFPGGGREPSDADLYATALREVNEEIGMQAHEVDAVGRLDDIRTISNYAVSPFVARVPDRQYEPDGFEVDEVVVLPLAGLTDLENYEAERREHPQYGDVLIHFFHVDGYTVWGATGSILVQFLTMSTDWRPPEGVDYVVDPDVDL